MTFFKVQVRVGQHWVPAHLGVMSEEKAHKLCQAYRSDRPSALVRIVKEKASTS